MVLLSARTRFRTSLPAVLSAVLLVFAIESFVAALRDPLANRAEHFINWIIRRDGYDVLLLTVDRVSWPQVVTSLTVGVLFLVLALFLAAWARTPKRRHQVK